MKEITDSKFVTDENEIDLLKVVQELWAGRKIILITIAMFVFFGGFYVLFKHLTLIPEYESSVTLYIDSPNPEVLPTLITGAPFMAEVLNIRLSNPRSSLPVTVAEVLNKYTEPPQGNIAGLMGRISSKLGKPGTLHVIVVLQDPLMAKQLADSIAQKLAPFLLTFQTQRSLKNLQFLKGRYSDAEAAYFLSLKTLNEFYNQNAKVTSNIDSITLKRLRAESEIKFTIFSDLAKQLEKTRIQQQESLPVYSILEPATTACQTNTPSIGRPIFFMAFFGLIMGICVLFGKRLYYSYTKVIPIIPIEKGSSIGIKN